MSLNVRPSDDCRRHLSDLRNGEPLDMGQRTGRCRLYLLNVVYSLVERPKSGILQFLSSNRNALCVALSVFVVRPRHYLPLTGKSRFSTTCYQGFW